MKEEKRYKKGYFIEIGVAIGIPLGIPIGLVLGNIALGPLLGVIIGLATGFIIERRKNKNPIEPPPKEKLKSKTMSWAGIIIGLVLFFSALFVYLFIR